MSMRVIDWDDFPGWQPALPLALTVGVFDGVHLGHRALIRRIREEVGCIPAVVTFKRNPLETIRPGDFAGDIFSLDRKLSSLKELGVELTVLIDFSREFGKMYGRDFIDLLLGCHPVKLIALGQDFRCGRGSDTGAGEIQSLARARGVESWVAPPVMDGGRPVSSSRIRMALAAGRVAEAERLLGSSLQIENGHADGVGR